MESEALNQLLEDALADLVVTEEKTEQPQTEEQLINNKPIEGKQKATTNKQKNKLKGKAAAAPTTSSKSSVDEEEINKFFANMTEQLKSEMPKIDPEEAQARLNDTVPQIFDLMQNLLSKELLYPALKDLSPKFDEWLKKNNSTLSKSDKKRYTKQRDLINQIIANFDDENIDQSKRFEKNLDLMEQMQSMGAPPDELTVPGAPRCPIM